MKMSGPSEENMLPSFRDRNGVDVFVGDDVKRKEGDKVIGTVCKIWQYRSDIVAMLVRMTVAGMGHGSYCGECIHKNTPMCRSSSCVNVRDWILSRKICDDCKECIYQCKVEKLEVSCVFKEMKEGGDRNG